MSQYRIISIYQRAINQEGAPLITKQGTVWKKRKFAATSRPHKQDSEYLENSVWICVHANGLGVVLLDIWFLCSCGK